MDHRRRNKKRPTQNRYNKHYNKGNKQKRYREPMSPLKKKAYEMMKQYRMDEATALEICSGVLPFEVWEEQQKELNYIHEKKAQLEDNIQKFSNQAMLSIRSSIHVLKGAFALKEYREQKISKLERTKKAELLAKKENIPLHIAKLIVDGRFTAKQYKEQQKKKADRHKQARDIQKKHPSIALGTCYSIIDEGIDVEIYLKRREVNREKRRIWYHNYLKEHQNDNRPLSLYLQKLKNKNIPVFFSHFSKNSYVRNVIGHTPYEIKVKNKYGKSAIFPKLDLKYICRASYAEKILSLLEINRELQESPISPSNNPYDRYKIPENLLKEGKKIKVVLGGGEIITGVIKWVSKYDMKLSLAYESKCSIIIFMHAIINAISLDD